MRIARVAIDDCVLMGRVESRPDGDLLLPLEDGALGRIVADVVDRPYELQDLRLLPPTQPSKIVAIGRNYGDHATELAEDPSERPRIFLKPPSSLIAAYEAIRCPPQSHEVHHEAELAVIIGRACRNVPVADALSVIFGLTCANDVTARDIQRAEGLPSYAKSFDTFCPLGPWIETELAPDDLRIVCGVNGYVRQDGRTRDMLWSVPQLIAHVSAAMTLFPGDVLLTGTPAGVGPIEPGDEVEVTIDGIGTLKNPVVAA